MTLPVAAARACLSPSALPWRRFALFDNAFGLYSPYDEGVTDPTDHDPVPSGGTQPLSRAELLGVFAFWTLMAVLTASNRLADQGNASFSAVPRAVPIGLAFQQMYLWALLTPVVFWLAGRFNVEQSSTWMKILILIVIGIVIAYSVDLINSTLVRTFRGPPQPQSPSRIAIAAGA